MVIDLALLNLRLSIFKYTTKALKQLWTTIRCIIKFRAMPLNLPPYVSFVIINNRENNVETRMISRFVSVERKMFKSLSLCYDTFQET